MTITARVDRAQDVLVRRMSKSDHDDADRIMRLAFGTLLGLADPMAFDGDGDYVRGRWAAAPDLALIAELDQRVVGSNFVTQWGSVGYFGPLTVAPSEWDRGIGRRLLGSTMEIMSSWDLTHAGLFTLGHTSQQIAFYQQFGFRPKFLIARLSVPAPFAAPSAESAGWTTYSSDPDRMRRLADCASITDAIYPGLDVTREVRSCYAQGLGDTVLLDDGSGFAVCHVGAGTEAGSGNCYIKFAAARPGRSFEFDRLIDACEAFAAEQGATRVVAGVSTARREACRILGERGYRADLLGVAMHRPDEPGYHRPDALVVDDWR
jgi:GNAT superfamily N-acetyltransferase